MTARELKYTFIKEAMSILDNEELMLKAIEAIRHYKKAIAEKKTEEEPLRKAFKAVKGIKEGQVKSRPIQELLDEI